MVDLSIARKHIESLYLGTFSAFERIKRKNPETKIIEFVEQEYISNQPCKLSFTSFVATNGDVAGSTSLTTKLFYAPEITLKEGSKLVVNQNGREYVLCNSGIVRYGVNHNEVEVINFDKWA